MLLTAEGLSAYIGPKSYSARDGLNDIICTWRHCMGASLEEKNKSTADAVNSTMLQLATRGLLIETAQAVGLCCLLQASRNNLSRKKQRIYCVG